MVQVQPKKKFWRKAGILKTNPFGNNSGKIGKKVEKKYTKKVEVNLGEKNVGIRT